MKKQIIDINYAKVESYIHDKRPPADVRSMLDLGFSYVDNTFQLFEIRPIFGKKSNEYLQIPFAKFRYIKRKKIWKLYWKRASGKWVSYDPLPSTTNVDQILKCIEEDKYGCFYG